MPNRRFSKVIATMIPLLLLQHRFFHYIDTL